MFSYKATEIDRTTCSFRYLGDFEGINALTFSRSLQHFCDVLKEIGEGLYPELDSMIVLRATGPGSFEATLILMLAAAYASLPFMDQGVLLARNILQYFSSALQILRHLGGEPPKQINPVDENHVSIVNAEDSALVVQRDCLNLLQQRPQINISIAQAFFILGNDPNINGFSVLEKEEKEEKEIFKANKEDFDRLSRKVEIKPPGRTLLVKALLEVVKPSLIPDYKWVFLWEGQRISASMEDEDFKKQVLAGTIRFGHGDHLQVEMEIFQEFDPKLETYRDRDYRIIKVLEFFPSSNQMKLFK